MLRGLGAPQGSVRVPYADKACFSRHSGVTAGTRILVGVVGAPHGVRGELRLKSFTGEPMAVTTYGPLATEDAGGSLTITSARLLKGDMLVVRFDGVADRTAAERLTNLRLYVDRARLPATDDDEFYHADLVGLRAETTSGALIGAVVALQNFGAGDLLEVGQEKGDNLLVPFSKAFVPVVDLPGRRVVVADEALDDRRAHPADADKAEGQ